jgi:hypothetical protein
MENDVNLRAKITADATAGVFTVSLREVQQQNEIFASNGTSHCFIVA